MATEGRWKMGDSFCELKGYLWDFYSPISRNYKTQSREGLLHFHLWWICLSLPTPITNENLLFLYSPTYSWPFPQQNAPQEIANRWELKSLAGAGTQCMNKSRAEQTAGSTKEEGVHFALGQRSQSLCEGGLAPTEPGSTGHGGKKSLSLESQQGDDGRRLGLSNESSSPSEPCWVTMLIGQTMELYNLVWGWRGLKNTPQRHLKK